MNLTPDQSIRLARLLWPEREWAICGTTVAFGVPVEVEAGPGDPAIDFQVVYADLTSPEAIGLMVEWLHLNAKWGRWRNTRVQDEFLDAVIAGDWTALARLVLAVLEEQTDE